MCSWVGIDFTPRCLWATEERIVEEERLCGPNPGSSSSSLSSASGHAVLMQGWNLQRERARTHSSFKRLFKQTLSLQPERPGRGRREAWGEERWGVDWCHFLLSRWLSRAPTMKTGLYLSSLEFHAPPSLSPSPSPLSSPHPDPSSLPEGGFTPMDQIGSKLEDSSGRSEWSLSPCVPKSFVREYVQNKRRGGWQFVRVLAQPLPCGLPYNRAIRQV